MDYSKFMLSNKKEESINIQRVKVGFERSSFHCAVYFSIVQ